MIMLSKAAWFWTHCSSLGGREKLLPALRRHMRVDVYGECGELECGQIVEMANLAGNASCYAEMARSYKFYLSFENSLCDGYVTEKLFNVLPHDVVPVVFGGADYGAVMPPHSHVNVLDYGSVVELVAHLRRLHEDDALFASHFWWRNYFKARAVALIQHATTVCCRYNKLFKVKIYNILNYLFN